MTLLIDDERKLKKFLEKKKLKLTSERKKILEMTYNSISHFQPEDLLITMRKEGVNVSKATIYRTLPIMVECGLLRKIYISDKQTNYEYIHDNVIHHHLICVNCGNILKFQDDKIESQLENIAEEHDFVVQKYIVEIEGYCKECKFAIP